jgi:hypothetical protein
MSSLRRDSFLFLLSLFLFLSAICASAWAGPQAKDSTPADVETPDEMQMHSVLHALLEGDVYIEPATQPYADPKDVAEAVRGTNSTYVEPKVVVLEQLPLSAANADETATDLHQSLSLGTRGLVVLIAGHSVAAYGAGLPQDELQTIVQSAARTFDSETYAAGIAQIVRSADQKRGQQISNIRALLLVLAGLVAGGIYLVMRRKRKRYTTRLNAARERACELSVRLSSRLETLNSDYSLLDDNAQQSAQIAEQHRAAAQVLADASKTLDDARSAEEFEAALHSLQSAESAIQQTRAALESIALHNSTPLDQSDSSEENEPINADEQHPATRPVAQDALSST